MTALKLGTHAVGNPTRRRSVGMFDFAKGGYFMYRDPGLNEKKGSILYGGGRTISSSREMGTTDDSKVHPKIATYLHYAPSHIFGPKSWGDDVNVVNDWTGIVCYTPDTFPLVGESPGEKGLWMSVGMNEHGSKCIAYHLGLT